MRISFNGVEKEFDDYFNEIKRVLTCDEFKDVIINKISFVTCKDTYGNANYLRLYTNFDCAGGEKITAINYYYKAYIVLDYFHYKNIPKDMDIRIEAFYNDIKKIIQYVSDNHKTITIDSSGVRFYKFIADGVNYYISEIF